MVTNSDLAGLFSQNTTNNAFTWARVSYVNGDGTVDLEYSPGNTVRAIAVADVSPQDRVLVLILDKTSVILGRVR